ncbi:alpha/beta fold hydrolase [Pseudoroseomonas wenyumeiae]|uniref:Alpha/beta fold hydrolase n=1 Tax=Teichococcus wenyumeiae TaxID=2478470 RepID=A0A3A9JTQ5_9PROT|nr:alpha/beta fold hydrolase [Pseudoroseomonas wenyumeiae]RKK04108.1 S9 family peptidase [Pseudoroseomonas wenyumeiae]RMI19658.1 alpha/beta fold hydrolase [Pseudoroseomonas wenyumeiae]
MPDTASRLGALLAATAATAPSHAADGRLYFLCDAGGSAQVWELPADGAPARPRSDHRDAVAFVAGSPTDGGAIFGRDQAGDERVQLHHLPPEGPARALTADPRVIHGWGAIAPDGRSLACTANSRDPAHTDPCVIDIASGTPRRVLEVEGPHELPAWHPDGRSLVLARAPKTFESDLIGVEIATGATTRLTPHEGEWRHMNPRWRRDGSGFWLLTDRGRDFLGLAFQVPGGTPAFLHAPEADVEQLEPSPDQSRLAVVVNEEGYSRLRILDAASGAVLEQPSYPAGVITRISWHPDGASLAFDLACPTRPSTLWRHRLRQPEAELIFAPAEAPAALRDWQLVRFPTFDGRELPAFLALPEGTAPAGGWPLLVWVHGGPESQARPNWRPDLQLVLSLGIAVLVPNVRGSTGYGRAYAALDDRELRLDSVRDLAAAHAWAAAQERFDARRIAVMGQSYGGWMVLAAVTEYPELWAAGVDYYGIARWKTFFERTGPWRIGHRAAEYGDPVRDAELLERLSPLHKADRIQCPMLVAQGMTDPRVPPQESEQIVEALRRRQVPVDYVTFPDEGHGFLKRDNRRRIYLAVADFLARHLLDNRAAS